MGSGSGQSTPGTQSVPGQTPQTETTAPARPEHPAHLQALLDAVPDCNVPLWRFYDGIATANVPPERLVEVVRWLQQDARPRFDMFVELCGAHWPSRERPFEVTYIFHALETNSRIRLKCSVGGESPTLPTISHLWPVANWAEREIFDMFGVTFDGHPDLRRILTPVDWEGHPLRKDFPLGEEPVEFYLPSAPGSNASPRLPSPGPTTTPVTPPALP